MSQQNSIALGAFAAVSDWPRTIEHHGERYLPLVKPYNAAMHLGHMASYREALRYSYGRRVLDVGCGVGYGAFFLASYGAGQVTALDFSGESLTYAQAVYRHPRLDFVHANALSLPFPDTSFDFVFSSQVIEHVPVATQFLQELKRVLTADGFCMITTPNQTLFSPNGQSGNIHHLNEMDTLTYQAAVQTMFPHVRLRGIPQRCLQRVTEQSEPTVKPNTEINIYDYRVQDDSLDDCENLLCFAHQQPDGEFTTHLPHTLQGAADELQPFFWDPTVAHWVILGAYPADELAAPLSQYRRQRLTQPFKSAHAGLYRIEVDLTSSFIPSTHTSVCVNLQTISQSRVSNVCQYIVPIERDRLVVLFEPQADSAGRHYRLTIDYNWRWRDVWRPTSPILWQTCASPQPKTSCLLNERTTGVRLALRTFHQTLPHVCKD